jgi:LuxR family transcriptional regulator, maltose regulon positive regulatory protein
MGFRTFVIDWPRIWRDLTLSSPVFEELTAREEAVLYLLPGGLSAREIGSELGVTRNTIKTHTKSLYRKLGAAGRREAVARGRQLGLL